MSGVLENRVAIVTGGARGIGFAIAQTMVMEGAKVVIVDNGCALDGALEDSVAAEAAADRLNRMSEGSALAMSHSVTEPGCAMAAISVAREEFGYVDILINNAAIQRPQGICELSVDDLQAVIQTNLLAPTVFAQAMCRQLRDQSRQGRLPGSIVNLGSVSGAYGDPIDVAGSCAKAGLLGLTRSVALSMYDAGVTCNAVIPFAATRATHAMNASTEPRAAYRQRALQIPARYVANVVTWLASSQGSRVNGQFFGVRGRELFLMQQARPSVNAFLEKGAFDADTIASLVNSRLAFDFADLRTEWDSFNSDPLL